VLPPDTSNLFVQIWAKVCFGELVFITQATTQLLLLRVSERKFS